MKRYPDEILILRVEGDTPYEEPDYHQIYRGKCRCFLSKQAAFRTNRVMDCTHEVVIPDRSMPEIGENFKVAIKMHTSTNNRAWDLVGYVKDFARYDRVCNIYFQMVKENLIYEDIPSPAVDLSERRNMVYEGNGVRMESVGLVGNDFLVEYEVLVVTPRNGYSVSFYANDNKNEWQLFMDNSIIEPVHNFEQVASAEVFRNNNTNSDRFIVVCKHVELVSEPDEDGNVEVYEPKIKIEVKDIYREICEEKVLTIVNSE